MFGSAPFAAAPFADIGSGVIYDLAVAETVTGSDAVNSQMDFVGTVADTVTVTDVVNAQTDFVGSIA